MPSIQFPFVSVDYGNNGRTAVTHDRKEVFHTVRFRSIEQITKDEKLRKKAFLEEYRRKKRLKNI